MSIPRKELAKLRQSDNYADIERRFIGFTEELGKLSTAYGIGIQSTGGIGFYYDHEKIVYVQDFTSGDLDYKVHEKARTKKPKSTAKPKRKLSLFGRKRKG